MGKSFFWMGDTAWGLNKLGDGDLDIYLANLQAKMFNVLQIIIRIPNNSGQSPYLNNNTDTPNAPFWSRLDTVISRAESRGFYVVLVPLWGREYTEMFGTDTAKATRLGQWLGARYKSRTNVLWLTSGEYDSINGYTLPITTGQKALLNALAQGLESGHGGTQLMSIHPGAAFTSSLDFHGAFWLDFNSLQSGHEGNRDAYGHPENHTSVSQDYALSPIKPVLDTEPFYEDTPDGMYQFGRDINRPRGGADVVRRKAYWAVFAGAFGHTYGHNDVYKFWLPGETAGSGQRNSWKTSIKAPGSSQMKYLRTLIESKPILTRIPDQSILASSALTGNDHIRATRDANGTYAWIYAATGQTFSVNMSKIAGSSAKASWLDPRTGALSALGSFPNTGTRTFDPPGSPAPGNDWVLILESSSTVTATPTLSRTDVIVPPLFHLHKIPIQRLAHDESQNRPRSVVLLMAYTAPPPRHEIGVASTANHDDTPASLHMFDGRLRSDEYGPQVHCHCPINIFQPIVIEGAITAMNQNELPPDYVQPP